VASDNKSSKLSLRDIALKGSVIAIIVTVPSLVSFGIVWMILDNLFQAAVIGAIIHVIAMGFSLKIAKKIQINRNS
jgi:hypothetical protein